MKSNLSIDFFFFKKEMKFQMLFTFYTSILTVPFLPSHIGQWEITEKKYLSTLLQSHVK